MNRMRLATICLTAALLAGLGCVPDPLEGFDDMGTNPNSNANSMTGDMSNNTTDMGTGGGNFNPEFLAVSAILRQNCAIGGCHGLGSGAYFSVPTGPNATDAEMQTALENTIPTSTGQRLIAPGSSSTSEIYVRVSKPAGDTQLMGAMTYGAAATPLMAAQITAIQTWIDNGATYTQ